MHVDIEFYNGSSSLSSPNFLQKMLSYIYTAKNSTKKATHITKFPGFKIEFQGRAEESLSVHPWLRRFRMLPEPRISLEAFA